jgi:hypothetical protein
MFPLSQGKFFHGIWAESRHSAAGFCESLAEMGLKMAARTRIDVSRKNLAARNDTSCRAAPMLLLAASTIVRNDQPEG